jgi:hypothetical protein
MIWDPQTHLLSGRHFSVVVMVCESGRGSPRGGMEGREEAEGGRHDSFIKWFGHFSVCCVRCHSISRLNKEQRSNQEDEDSKFEKLLLTEDSQLPR